MIITIYGHVTLDSTPITGSTPLVRGVHQGSRAQAPRLLSLTARHCGLVPRCARGSSGRAGVLYPNPTAHSNATVTPAPTAQIYVVIIALYGHRNPARRCHHHVSFRMVLERFCCLDPTVLDDDALRAVHETFLLLDHGMIGREEDVHIW